MSAKSPYPSLYARIIANTAEPDNGQQCWVWTAKYGRGGYGRFNLYVPGLGTEVTLMAHIALWVWLETSPRSIDEFYLFYIELIASGLEVDHLCVWACCVNPDHLEPVTPRVNCQRRNARRGVRQGVQGA